MYGQKGVEESKKLCCCQEKVPHDETQKFMIIKRQYEKLDELQIIKQSLSADQAAQVDLENSKKIDIQNLIDEKSLDIPLFPEKHDKSNHNEKMRIKIKDDISEKNSLPCTKDGLKVVGRNLEVQNIVEQLNQDNEEVKSKLLHVFGNEGVGKTEIVLHAAKYAFERKFFPDGAYYIDMANRT